MSIKSPTERRFIYKLVVRQEEEEEANVLADDCSWSDECEEPKDFDLPTISSTMQPHQLGVETPGEAVLSDTLANNTSYSRLTTSTNYGHSRYLVPSKKVDQNQSFSTTSSSSVDPPGGRLCPQPVVLVGSPPCTLNDVIA
jgi:hypothetical protein